MQAKSIQVFIISILEGECDRCERVSCLNDMPSEYLAMIQASLRRQIKQPPWNSPDVIPLAQLSLLIQRQLINRQNEGKIA